MQLILEELKNGNVEVVEFFLEANKLWSVLLEDIDSISVAELAERLHVKQYHFEKICGDRYLGKSVMAWSAFPYLYSCDVGFEDNGERAYKLMQAFSKSYCSGEVKFAAEDAAKMYGVLEYQRQTSCQTLEFAD